MTLDTGLRLFTFLVIFGVTNYLMMLRRYEKDLKKRKLIQKNKISTLYPKGTFV